MSGLRLRDMTWLRGVRRDYKDKQRMVQRLISWVYSQLIIPLLRIHFYVTESGQYGYVHRWRVTEAGRPQSHARMHTTHTHTQ